MSDDMAAAMVEYVSDPDDVTTRVVKVELLPPPCSMCRISAVSSTFASVFVYDLSGRSIMSRFSAVESFALGRWIIILSCFS